MDSRDRIVYRDENTGDVWPGQLLKSRPDLGSDFADLVIFTTPERARPEDIGFVLGSQAVGVCVMLGVELSLNNNYPPDQATFCTV